MKRSTPKAQRIAIRRLRDRIRDRTPGRLMAHRVQNKKRALNGYYRSEKQKAKHKKYMQKYRKSHKGICQQAAYGAVKMAVKLGRLVRLPCEICLSNKVSAHHDSYLKDDRLNVRWLCKKHHTHWHLCHQPIYPRRIA